MHANHVLLTSTRYFVYFHNYEQTIPVFFIPSECGVTTILVLWLFAIKHNVWRRVYRVKPDTNKHLNVSHIKQLSHQIPLMLIEGTTIEMFPPDVKDIFNGYVLSPSFYQLNGNISKIVKHVCSRLYQWKNCLFL